MTRFIAFAYAAITALAATTSMALASDGGLVRIEPRPYYGAVVTIEHGVRVYRPLPTQQLMIINPNNVPVNVTFNRTIANYTAESTAADDSRGSHNGYAGYSGFGGYGGYGSDRGKRREMKRVSGVYEGRRHMSHRPRHKPSHH